MRHEDEDNLRALLQRHKPAVPPTPSDEWAKIQDRTLGKNPQKKWLAWTLLASLALALLLCVPQRKARESDEWNELWQDDISLSANPHAYDDWLQLTDSLDSQEL